STGSHQNSEVKRAWARVVLGWVTSWEVLVLHSFFFDFGRFDSQNVVNILRASSHSGIRNQRGRAARGEAVKHLRGARARGPRVASARRGTGIRGRMGASMWDEKKTAVKHRTPQELR